MKLIKDLSIGDKVFFYDIYNKSISITEVMIDRIGLYCPYDNKHYYLITEFEEFNLMINNSYIIFVQIDLVMINDTLNKFINYMNHFSFLLLFSLHNHAQFTTVDVTDDDCERLIYYDSRDSLKYNIKLLFRVLSSYNKPWKLDYDKMIYFSDIFGKLSFIVYDLQKYINTLSDFIYLSISNSIKYD